MHCDEVIRLLRESGWIEIAPRTFRNHRHFRHIAKEGRVTVPQLENIPELTLMRIAKTAGINLSMSQLALLEEK